MPPSEHGRPPRLRGWDYSSAGWYFVTFCTLYRRPCLGVHDDGRLYLSPSGEVVRQVWERLPDRFRGLRLGPMAIMPDHVHALVRLSGRRGGWLERPLSLGFTPMMADPRLVLGKVVRSWKAGATWRIRRGGDASFRWQHRFYDSIVRDRDGFLRVSAYIRNHSIRS